MKGGQSVQLPGAAGKSPMCLGKGKPCGRTRTPRVWQGGAGLLSQGRVLVFIVGAWELLKGCSLL